MKKVFFILLLMSCGGSKLNNIKLSLEDSFRNSLTGEWGGINTSGKPVWKITHDSMYIYEGKQAYPYSVNGTDFNINSYPVIIHFKNVHVIKDTLFFSERISLTEEIYGENRAIRHK
jgi:hypothetical protein